MKPTRQTLWIGLVVVVALALGGHALFKHSVAPSQKESAMLSMTGEQEFNEIVENGSKLVMFDLYADWCGPCRMLHPTLETIAKKYAGRAVFYQVNVDHNQAVARSLGATSIPLVVFVKDKRVINSIVGVHPAEAYEKIIEEAGVPATSNSN